MIQQEIINKIKFYDTIIIHRHVRPDPDAIGSQCGLKQLIKNTFPDKNVYAAGKEETSLNFLARMDLIDDDMYTGALVIVCDTANTIRICDQRYKDGAELIKIDHHPDNDSYGDLKWVDTNASSTCELIYEFFALLNKELIMDEEAARLIYAGIVGDTGRFLFPSTTNKTFRYAAKLIEYPFDRQELYDGMYTTSRNVAKLQGYILENHTLSETGLSTVTLTEEILKSHGVTPDETGKVVGILGDIEGIKMWVFFIEEAGIVRVRFRSKRIVINKTAEKYNGGGHPLAAGATVNSWEEAAEVEKDLEELCAQHTKL